MSSPEQHPQQYELALERFLAAHPSVRETLDHLNPLAAQARGESLQRYREERLHEAFEAEAERQGLFAWELTLQLTSGSAEEFETRRLEVHREVAEMAGMEWSQYCTLHGLSAG
ncbi:DNA repair protein [Pseudomonas gingeri]|uniref:DUF6388 family protein n=1 Tax=Pseudomonas gingeri TaxID=117681 RepID=UPI0015A3939A|nr:DUF6388 family protein [Pseudomonas gingeri]NVZ60481.1 DNA repair protein [Pseudomonas gingeri]NVZ74242.1 DNA repair protein [Pseudomonas gingeri]NWE48057.1 DNA repair protein [Pseudomonas gingeri]